MPEMAQILTGKSCKPNRRIPFNVKLFGPYEGHVWAILGPCFGYFYYIFAAKCLIWHKFLLMYCMKIRKKIIGTILGQCLINIEPCFGYFYYIFASRCLKWLNFSLESHASPIEENHSILDYWNHIRAIFRP